MAPASSVMPPRPAATATRASAIGTSAATIVPNATTSTTSAASRPAASAPEVSVSALMNAASPPSSAVTPAARAGSIAAATAATRSWPSSVDGTSKTISAKPMRPSGDSVPAVNGSVTVATCSRSAIRATAASTAGRWLSSRSPSGAANTAIAVPPAASGKRSSSSSIACSLWLPGATKSSTKAPPAVPASAMTTATATAQAPIVTHGRRALASPMRRMKRCMRVLLRWSGPDDGAPAVAPLNGGAPGPARSPAAGRVGPPPRGGSWAAAGAWTPPVRRRPHPPGGG